MASKNKIEKAIQEAENIDYDKDGNAIIHVGLKSKEEFYNEYCHGEYKTLNVEMTDFIEENAKKLPQNKDLTLKIHTSSEISPKEKEEMQKAIRREYADKYVLLNKKLKTNLFLTIILTIVGLGVLALAVLFENLEWSSILSNTVMIAAWVFLWEAVEFFFFNRAEIRHKKKVVKRFLSCNLIIGK